MGIAHHIESTLLLLEAYLPRFFAGILHAYRSSSIKKTDALASAAAGAEEQEEEEVSINVLDRRLMLQNKMISLDLDLYEFVLQKFQMQLQNLMK